MEVGEGNFFKKHLCPGDHSLIHLFNIHVKYCRDMKIKGCGSCPQGVYSLLERQTNKDAAIMWCDKTYNGSVCRRSGYSTRDRPPQCVCLFFIVNCFSLVQDSFKVQGPWEATEPKTRREGDREECSRQEGEHVQRL